jgi:zinc protease
VHLKLKFCFCIFLIISLPVFAEPVVNIQHWITANGAQVLFVETHDLPMIAVQIAFNAGSACDNEQYGVAQFTNAMLEEGTKTLTADQIANAFDKVGAKFNASVNKDMAIVSLRSLTQKKLLNSALDTFAEVLTQPNFPEQAFQRVQKQILSAIAEQQQQPLVIANDALWHELYGDLPYGHSVLGTSQSIQAITPQDLQTFYQNYYVAKNAVITLVGDVTLDEAKAIIERAIAKLPSGQTAAKLPPISVLNSAKTKHIDFPSAQTNVLIGQIGIARDDQDYFPLSVGNFILGQSPLTSELFQEVRNKRGLAYSIGSGFAALQTQGPFCIVLQTRTEEAKQAIKVTKETLAKFVKRGPTKKQLNAAKQSLIGRFPLQLASNDGILSVLTVIGFYHLPLDYLDTYRPKISAVTLEQIQDAFKHHIQPKKMVTVTVG